MMIDPIQAFMQANSLVAPLFPPESRYYGIAATQRAQADGTSITYLQRRFVPQPDNFSQVQAHIVSGGDRLDNLAASYIGDPTQYWRICDANGAVRPDELTETAGKSLRITLPEGVPGVNDAG
jgi:hypothetical protein